MREIVYAKKGPREVKNKGFMYEVFEQGIGHDESRYQFKVCITRWNK
jgi:hypothetical protein